MKILFIYPNLGCTIGFSIGVCTLSAILKKKGHKVKLIHLNESLGFPLDKVRIKNIILEFKPNIIGFSVDSNQFPIGIEIAEFIKDNINKSIPIIFGGIHPTLNPEETLNHNAVDMVLVGEGEEALPELIENLEKNQDISHIKNIWLKKNGKIVINKLRNFISLKKIPFMDTDVMDYQKIINNRNGWIDVILTRGCPRNCTFCFNETYRRIYSHHCVSYDIHKYVRIDDYTKIIQGIKRILEKYKNIKAVNFNDDDFLLFSPILGFIKSFKKKIGLPFMISAHINSINEKKLKILKECGCDLIRVGLECGNEKIRKNILKRNISNKQIIEKIMLIKKHKIRSYTFNMIGLPTEKKDDVIKTLRLNVICNPDVVRISTFYPYKGTKIYSVCNDLGLLPIDLSKSTLTYFDQTILNFDDKFILFLEKIQKYFDCYLNYYIQELSSTFKELIKSITKLTKQEFEDTSIQKQIQNKIQCISRELSLKNIRHYAKRFTQYYAVKI